MANLQSSENAALCLPCLRIQKLRVKYKIMTSCWLLAQMRQLGRHFYDFTRMTFIDFLDELLSERNLLMDKTFGENRVVRPDWSLCMGFELELRREAIKYTREKGLSIQEALWAVYRNDHHRLENFSNFLRPSDTPQSADKNKTVQALQKKVADLERQMRSRSPRGRNMQRALPAASSFSSQLASQPVSTRKTKGKGKGKEKKGKSSNQGAPQHIQSFNQPMALHKDLRPRFFQQPSGSYVCFAFNGKQCTDSACARLHVCVGCGKAVPFDDCKCLRASASDLLIPTIGTTVRAPSTVHVPQCTPSLVKGAVQFDTFLVMSFNGPFRHADVEKAFLEQRAGRVTFLFIVPWFTTTSTCHKMLELFDRIVSGFFSRLSSWFHPHLHGLAFAIKAKDNHLYALVLNLLLTQNCPLSPGNAFSSPIMLSRLQLLPDFAFGQPDNFLVSHDARRFWRRVEKPRRGQ